MGPFKEGDPLTIMCVATGGEPPPSVLWYKENLIIDRWENTTSTCAIKQGVSGKKHSQSSSMNGPKPKPSEKYFFERRIV